MAAVATTSCETMPTLFEHHELNGFSHPFRRADSVKSHLLSQMIGATNRNHPPVWLTEKTARIERLIQSAAWTDAAFALVDLELPQWQVRRIAYDDGEWYCTLSRRRQLPEWLDESIETHHADLPLAILGALAEAQSAGNIHSGRTSVPPVSHGANPPCVPLCCDNFS